SAAVLPTDTPLAERTNMVYKGTTVAAGTARVLVTATGPATELGRIGALVGGLRDEPTPLERRLDELGRRLVCLTIAVAALVAILGAVQGLPLALVLETGIALAVAAVPEALPAVATIALAVGVRRMARRHALVRRLPAVESLGSTTVVCTDKTRTLTSGEMTLVRVWTAGQDFEIGTDRAEPAPLAAQYAIEVAALASRVQAQRTGDFADSTGDPVDAAVFRAAERVSLDRSPLASGEAPVAVIPFSSERKLMASFHRTDGHLVAYVKGGPRQMLALSGRGLAGEQLDEERRQALMSVNDALARAGLRVLGVATGPVEAPTEEALHDLAFVGFIGLMDPPAPQVRQTVERLREAGLRTV